MIIKCLPIRVIFDYCMECHKITPYDQGYCFYCHSAAPLGDPCDTDISSEEWDNEFMKHSILVVNVSDLDKNTLSFLSNK
jgi:RNA polymerase subunit RPABC4/transcription elongation factor Spt4